MLSLILINVYIVWFMDDNTLIDHTIFNFKFNFVQYLENTVLFVSRNYWRRKLLSVDSSCGKRIS